MAGSKSTALKNARRIIPTAPKARTRRETARQRARCERVVTRKGATKSPLTVAELRARDTSRDFGIAVKVTVSGKVY